MKGIRLDQVEIEQPQERMSAWTFGGASVRGTEWRYRVVDRTSPSRNRWEFVVQVPQDRAGRIVVRPVTVPNVKAFSDLDWRSLTFTPALRQRYRAFRYCQLSLADPTGDRNRDVVDVQEKPQLPAWIGRLGWRIKKRATITKTRRRNDRSLALLVRPADYEMMIRLYFATKVWVLREHVVLD